MFYLDSVSHRSDSAEKESPPMLRQRHATPMPTVNALPTAWSRLQEGLHARDLGPRVNLIHPSLDTAQRVGLCCDVDRVGWVGWSVQGGRVERAAYHLQHQSKGVSITRESVVCRDGVLQGTLLRTSLPLLGSGG